VKHLFALRVTNGDPGFAPEVATIRAYDEEDAVERFYELNDEGWQVLAVAPRMESRRKTGDALARAAR
jgi:hypothetical protein